jgi:hypothetical protein
MATPNIAALQNITGTTTVTSNLATSATNLSGSVIVPTVTTNHVFKINSVIAANKTTSSIPVSLVLYRNSIPYYVSSNIFVPPNASIILVGKDTVFYMMDIYQDTLYAITTVASAIDVIASYEDIS